MCSQEFVEDPYLNVCRCCRDDIFSASDQLASLFIVGEDVCRCSEHPHLYLYIREYIYVLCILHICAVSEANLMGHKGRRIEPKIWYIVYSTT